MRRHTYKYRWLVLAIGVFASAWVTASAAEPLDKPGQEAPTKWEGEYPKLPIEKVTREEFDAGWQIDLSVEDKPLQEVLESIVKPVTDWDVEIEPHDVLSKKISLDLKKVSRLEAIELACREVQHHPEYSSTQNSNRFDNITKKLQELPREQWDDFLKNLHYDDNANVPTIIKLVPGKYPAVKGIGKRAEPYPSVAFAGPVRIQIKEIKEEAPLATGEVELQFEWLPLPKHVGPEANHEPAEMNWQIGAIIGPQGENLIADKDSQIHQRGIYGTGDKSLLNSRTKRMSLSGLVQSIDRIGMFFCHVHFYLPTEWKPIWFENPKSGDVKTVDSYRASYGGKWYPGNASGFMFDVNGLGSREHIKQIRIFAFDGDGNSVNPGVSLIEGTKTSGRSLHFFETPALFVIVPITRSIDVEYSQAFKDIPLAKYESQPKELPKLEFGDHPAPVSAEDLQRVDDERGTMRMKLTNHSNKPVQEVRVYVYRIDEQGNPISGNTSFLYFQGGSGLNEFSKLMDPGKSVVDEAVHYNPPPKDAKLRARVERVIFLDKTLWQRESKARRIINLDK